MNIWMVCPNAGSRIHGMNFRIYQYAREFAELGHQVRVFSGTWSHQFVVAPPSSTLFNQEQIDGIDYVWVKIPRYGDSSDPRRILGWFQFIRRMRLIRPGRWPAPDVVVVSSPVPYTIVSGLRLKRLFGAKLVFEIRDLWSLTMAVVGGHSSWHPLIWGTKLFERLAYRRSDAIVSVLANTEAHVRARGLGERPWKWIPNGIHPELPAGGDVRAPLELRPGLRDSLEAFRARHPFILAYTGSFNLTNATEVLLEVVRRVAADARIGFLFAGPSGGMREEIAEALKSEGLNHVLLVDAVPKSWVAGLLSYCDAGFIGYSSTRITRYGISPTKVYDYLLGRLPVILASSASDRGVSALPSVRLCPPRDVDAIVDILSTLVTADPVALRVTAEESRRQLLEEASLPRLAQTYVAFLESLNA